MKKFIAIILLGTLLLGLCACSSSQSEKEDPNAKIEKALVGEWIWKEHANNPIYTFLRFNGKTVRYGTNLLGQEAPNGVWDCTYVIDGTSLKLTTPDGTVFTFEIQTDGDTVRIFNNKGNEFVRTN